MSLVIRESASTSDGYVLGAATGAVKEFVSAAFLRMRMAEFLAGIPDWMKTAAWQRVAQLPWLSCK